MRSPRARASGTPADRPPTPAIARRWGNPEGWKGSLVKAFAVIFASWGVMGAISAGVEERPLARFRGVPPASGRARGARPSARVQAPKHKIPSSMWSRVKAVDDGYKSDPHV